LSPAKETCAARSEQLPHPGRCRPRGTAALHCAMDGAPAAVWAALRTLPRRSSQNPFVVRWTAPWLPYGRRSRRFHAAPLWIRQWLLREKKLFCCFFLRLLRQFCSCSFIFLPHAQVIPIGPVAFFRSPHSLVLSLSLSMLSWAPHGTKGERSLVVLGCSLPSFSLDKEVALLFWLLVLLD
jgi:hypothetical protein